MAKRNILVAAGPSASERARRALEADYDLEFATSVAEAREQLMRTHGHFAAVVCGVFFDESRMFELLEFMRRNDGLEALPFIAVHFARGATELTPAARRAAELLGANVVELHQLPIEQGDALLRETIEAAIPIRDVRSDRP